MKRIFSLFLVVAMAAWCTPGFAARQGVPPDADLTAGGQNEGVDFTAAGTLTVSGVGGFSNPHDVTTNAINRGIVVFNVPSVVTGNMGAVINTLDYIDINNGATTVAFTGTVFARIMDVGSGTVSFNDGTINNKAAVDFTGDGTINVITSAKVTGALTNNGFGAQGGTLNLRGAVAGQDQWTGQVGTATGGLRSINVDNGSTAGVTSQITGAVDTYAFELGTNRLNLRGGFAMNLRAGPGGGINTTLASASVYGNINSVGAFSYTGAAVTVNVTIPAGTVIPAGTIFTIVNDLGAGAGTTPIIVVLEGGTNPLYVFATGSTLNGDLQIQLTGNPITAAKNPPAGEILPPAAPIAAVVADAVAALPATSDIVLAINALTTASDVANAEAQLAPSTPVLKAPLATLQGARQFQNLWLSRLDMCQVNLPDTNVQSGVSSGDEMQGAGDGVWAKGFGYFGHQDARGAFGEYSAKTYGMMVAYDKPIGINTRAGLGLGYAYNTIDGKTYDAETDFDTYEATAYIGHEFGHWFVHGSGSFGWNEYSSSRHIVFPGVDRTAQADFSGQDYTAFANTGYHFYAKKFTITPIVSLQYSHVRVSDYTEKGAGDANLEVESQDYDFLESGLGVKVEREFSYHGRSYIPELHFKWLHELYNPKLEQTAAFAAGSESFTTPGLKSSDNTYSAGVGITLFSRVCRPISWSLEAVYDYDWTTDGYYANKGTMRVSLRF